MKGELLDTLRWRQLFAFTEQFRCHGNSVRTVTLEAVFLRRWRLRLQRCSHMHDFHRQPLVGRRWLPQPVGAFAEERPDLNRYDANPPERVG